MPREIGLQIPGANKNIPPLRVEPDKLESYKCKECQGEVFSQQYILKRLSALQSGSPTDTVVPIPVFICLNCGNQLHIEK